MCPAALRLGVWGGCLACSMLVFSVRQMFLSVVGPSWTGGDNALVLMGVVIGENVWDTRQLCGVCGGGREIVWRECRSNADCGARCR